MNLPKKQHLVYRVIELNPGVQNNDADLIAAVWRYEGWNDASTLESNIARVTRPETITRRRRELFNMGLIEYTDEAIEERTEAFVSERDMHSAFHPITRIDGISIEGFKRTKLIVNPFRKKA